MAEVVGTIVGVVSLGIQVTEGLVKYYITYKDRASDTAHTLKRLTHLLSVLETLRKRLCERKFRPEEESLLDVIKRSVGDCEGLIHELQHEAEKFSKAPSPDIVAVARATGRRLAYPFRQSTLQKLDEDIDELCANLSLALQVLQQQDLGSVRDEVQDTKALLGLMRADQVSSEIRTWLKAPDASINYNESCKKKHPGTGLWFIRGPGFDTWLRTARSVLWVHGFAGCGKSVLSSTIIQHTLRQRPLNPSTGIAFFYFTFTDASKQDASAMLRALILQLVSQLKHQDTPISRLHQSYHGTTPPDRALLDCLHELIGKFNDVYIILDALDESPRHKHREDLLQTLEDMRRWPEPGLHLLVTSRDEQDIRESLDLQPDQCVPMKSALVDADIASFVSGQLKDNRRLRKWEKYHDQIERALAEGAKGVFRWVECQLAALEACPGSKTRLDALLRSLPRTLDKTYERMLSNIDEESTEDAKRLLTLLCVAKRPLTVEELIDGIAVELGDCPRFNEDSRLVGEDDIRRICPGFIELDIDPEKDDIATVRIAHSSVQEFLESDRILNGVAAKFRVKRTEAHGEMSSICLTYLMDRRLDEAPKVWLTNFSGFYPSGYPLTPYAMEYWNEHYREGRGWDDTRLDLLVLERLRDDPTDFLSSLDKTHYRGKERARSPHQIAAKLGFDHAVRVLAGKGFPGLGDRDDYISALGAAADYGHLSTVQVILQYGAGIGFVGCTGDVLHRATWEGHIQVMETLLDGGADINAENDNGWTPLDAAVTMGNEKGVRLLLDRGVNVNPKSGAPEAPLEAAARNGRESIIAMLIDHGADLSLEKRQTPLDAARYHPRVAQLLISRGADPMSSFSLTPIEHAARYGDAELVEELVDEFGADVNFGRLKTPLETACVAGHAAVLHTLLERGADIDKAGGCADLLEFAASHGNTEVAQVLLDRGADVNRGREKTPLEAALSKFHVDHAIFLLERGARPSWASELEEMASESTEDIIKFLVLDEEDDGRKVPHLASQERQWTVDLLEAGKKKGYKTPIQLLVGKRKTTESIVATTCT